MALPGVGMSMLEISHRSKAFDAILAEATQGIRELLGVPEGYHILFLQGGREPAISHAGDEFAAQAERRPTTF